MKIDLTSIAHESMVTTVLSKNSNKLHSHARIVLQLPAKSTGHSFYGIERLNSAGAASTFKAIGVHGPKRNECDAPADGGGRGVRRKLVLARRVVQDIRAHFKAGLGCVAKNNGNGNMSQIDSTCLGSDIRHNAGHVGWLTVQQHFFYATAAFISQTKTDQ